MADGGGSGSAGGSPSKFSLGARRVGRGGGGSGSGSGARTDLFKAHMQQKRRQTEAPPPAASSAPSPRRRPPPPAAAAASASSSAPAAHKGKGKATTEQQLRQQQQQKDLASKVQRLTQQGGSAVSTAIPGLKATELFGGTQVLMTTADSGHAPGGAVARPNYANVPSSSIIVSRRQEGNPIVKHIRNVPWEYRDIAPDYIIGQGMCALFLSIRYHRLKPDYIFGRIQEVGRQYKLRVLLVLVDVKDAAKELADLAKVGVVNGLTVMVAWSNEEAGRYLETYKAYENKPPDQLQERTPDDYLSQATGVLTSVKSVNKTDVMTLLATFGSLADIVAADTDELRLLPGFGDSKVQRLSAVLDEPFVRPGRKKPSTFQPPS